MDRFVSDNAAYRVTGKLGKGGMGVTHLVRRESDDAEFVLKELRVEMLEEWKALDLFEREIATLEALDHAGIPKFIDRIVDRDEGVLALIQTRVNGRTLADVIERSQSLSRERFAGLLRQCLEILTYLHERIPAVVHRDVNPRNIMFDDDRAYLIDFGSVKVALSGSTTMTSVGTFGYMPPEQVHGDAEPASDLYGLGMTFIALATGREPSDLPKDRRTGQIDAASVLDVPEPTRSVLLEMVRPGLDARLGSARDALRELDGSPTHRKTARRLRQINLAVAGALGLVLAGGWTSTLFPSEHEIATLGGWWSGHGNVLAAAQATILGDVYVTHPAHVDAIAFTPDGTQLVSFASDGGRLWDVETGTTIASCDPPDLYPGYRALSVAPDGSVIAVGTWSGAALHDPVTLAPLRSLAWRGNGRMLDLRAGSADDVTIAKVVETEVAPRQYQASVEVVDAISGAIVFTDDLAWNRFTDGDINPAGTHLAIAGGDKTHETIVWDITTGERTVTIDHPDRTHERVLLSGDGTQVATLDFDGIKIWDVVTGEPIRTMGVGHTAHDAGLHALADFSWIAVTTDRGAQVFDGASGLLERTLDGHTLDVNAVAFAPDGATVATGSEDQTIKVWFSR